MRRVRVKSVRVTGVRWSAARGHYKSRSVFGFANDGTSAPSTLPTSGSRQSASVRLTGRFMQALDADYLLGLGAPSN